jgi:hypothetical protein
MAGFDPLDEFFFIYREIRFQRMPDCRPPPIGEYVNIIPDLRLLSALAGAGRPAEEMPMDAAMIDFRMTVRARRRSGVRISPRKFGDPPVPAAR